MNDTLIIGSGPAGLAVAEALIARGIRPVMLDVGERLEREREDLRTSLAAREPRQWDDGMLATLKAARQAETVDTIRPYGSDFLFRGVNEVFAAPGPPDWLALRPSFALGGLSNGWGAAVLPYRDRDLAAWPFGIDTLKPHYDAVAGFMPIAAMRDDLADLFPGLTIGEERPLPLSSQAATLLARLERHRSALAAAGLAFGRARQAVSDGCRRCGLCLYGCPYGLIFNAGRAVDRLARRQLLEYRPNHRVRALAREGTGWRIDLEGREPLTARRVFLAAGVLSTARLMLTSFGAPGDRLVLKDSQHFYLPMLHRWAPRPDPAQEARHTLTELFLELNDPAIAETGLHAQIYSYNDLYAVDMRPRFGRLAPAAGPVIAALSRRLIVMQGFLHSDLSASMEIGLDKGGLSFRLKTNDRADETMRRAARRMARLLAGAGLHGLMPLLRPGAPGSSFHSGGTFPMGDAPGRHQTDRLGRPADTEGLHLIDASVFPSIPATTITLSVMANAHRIGTEAPL